MTQISVEDMPSSLVPTSSSTESVVQRLPKYFWVMCVDAEPQEYGSNWMPRECVSMNIPGHFLKFPAVCRNVQFVKLFRALFSNRNSLS